MRLDTKRAFGLALGGLLAAGCGGSQKSAQEVAQHAPPPPPMHAAAGGATEQQPARSLAKETKEGFASASKKWAAMEDGHWTDGKCDDAASMWGKLADDDPSLVEARYDEGVAYQKCKMLRKAEEAYQAVLKQNAAYAPALANLGEIYWSGGKDDVAEQYLQQAKQADPKNVTARNDLALMHLLRAERPETDKATRDALIKDATEDLHAALAVDGSNMVAYTTLAEIYLATAGNDHSKLNIAQLVCDQAKQLNDKWAPLYNVYGLIQLRKRNISAALAQFKKAVTLDPTYIEANMNVGAITLSVRDYKSAEGAFSTVLTSQPKNFDALIGLGVAYRGEGKVDDAEKQYVAAQDVEKDNPETYYDLGLLYQDYRQSSPDQLKKAKDYYQQYVDHDGDKDVTTEKEAQRRIGIIDDTLTALSQAQAAQAQAAQQAAQQKQQAPASVPSSQKK